MLPKFPLWVKPPEMACHDRECSHPDIVDQGDRSMAVAARDEQPSPGHCLLIPCRDTSPGIRRCSRPSCERSFRAGDRQALTFTVSAGPLASRLGKRTPPPTPRSRCKRRRGSRSSLGPETGRCTHPLPAKDGFSLGRRLSPCRAGLRRICPPGPRLRPGRRPWRSPSPRPWRMPPRSERWHPPGTRT